MNKSILNPTIKSKRGRPVVDSDQVNARFPREILDGIAAFANDEPDKPVRSEALRRIARDWLIGHGYIKPTDTADSAD